MPNLDYVTMAIDEQTCTGGDFNPADYFRSGSDWTIKEVGDIDVIGSADELAHYFQVAGSVSA